MTDILDVYLGQTYVGHLTLLSGDRSFFMFAEEYSSCPHRPVLSQSFLTGSGDLISETGIFRTKLPPFFSNLLPEGHLRRYIAHRGNVKSVREFKLLELCGKDLPGAVTVQQRFDTIVTPAEISNIVSPPQNEKKNSLLSEQIYRFSLAGVQLKFSALAESTGCLTIPAGGVGGEWIIKLPAQNFIHVPENEWAMLHLAKKCGISVPETQLVSIDKIAGLPDVGFLAENLALVVKRFDRNSGQLIHIEDFAQIYNVYPHDKYDKVSYDNIANMIWILLGEPGLLEFIRRLVFNIMIGNGDMHLKNWSLIYKDGFTPELSPAYDFVSTIPYIPGDKLALNLAGEKNMTNINLSHFRKLTHKAEVPEHLVLNTVRETVETTITEWRKNKMSYSLPTAIMKRIDQHLNNVSLLV